VNRHYFCPAIAALENPKNDLTFIEMTKVRLFFVKKAKAATDDCSLMTAHGLQLIFVA
jgi:hypothetical protein